MQLQQPWRNSLSTRIRNTFAQNPKENFFREYTYIFKNRFFRRSSTLNRWIPVTTTLRKSSRQKTSLFCSFSERKTNTIFFPGKIFLKMFLSIRGRQFDKADEILLTMFENVRLRTESKFFNYFPEKSISSEHVRPNK